jgi:hypothetical protein
MKYSDTEILDWLIENVIETKPSGYDGLNITRFDMFIPVKNSTDIREHVIVELNKECDIKQRQSSNTINLIGNEPKPIFSKEFVTSILQENVMVVKFYKDAITTMSDDFPYICVRYTLIKDMLPRYSPIIDKLCENNDNLLPVWNYDDITWDILYIDSIISLTQT